MSKYYSGVTESSNMRDEYVSFCTGVTERSKIVGFNLCY
jgi:hypothetical protein